MKFNIIPKNNPAAILSRKGRENIQYISISIHKKKAIPEWDATKTCTGLGLPLFYVNQVWRHN